MKTIYVITNGEYSDYHIVSVFDTKEMAEKFIKNIGIGMTIEEYQLNLYEPHLKNDLKYFSISMDKNGNILRHEKKFNGDYYDHNSEKLYTMHEWLDGINIGRYIKVNCFAKDITHAIKITNEKRTKMVALNMWDDAPILKHISF